MTKVKRNILVFSILGLSAMLGYQNCGKMSAKKSFSSGNSFQSMDPEDVQDTVNNMEDYCGNNETAAATYSLLASGANVKVNMTERKHRASLVSSIKGIGNVALFADGDAEQTQVNSVNGYTGDMKLCGLNIESIDGTSYGNITVYDGTVKNIQGYTGSIFILNGAFPENIDCFDGTLIIKYPNGTVEGRVYQCHGTYYN